MLRKPTLSAKERPPGLPAEVCKATASYCSSVDGLEASLRLSGMARPLKELIQYLGAEIRDIYRGRVDWLVCIGSLQIQYIKPLGTVSACCLSTVLLWMVESLSCLPGYAIAALAFAAVVMTVRAEKFQPAERIIWVLIGAALMLAETRVLYMDRIAHDAEQAAERENQDDRFNKTAAGLKEAVTTSQGEFKLTMQKSQTIFSKTREAAYDAKEGIETFTGGNSYCFLDHFWPAISTGDPELDRYAMRDSGTGYLVKRGRHPLGGVSILVTSFTPNSETYVSEALPDFGVGDSHYTGVMRNKLRFSNQGIKDAGPESTLTIPKGLMMDADRFDIAIDYNGRNGSWRQVFHGVVKEKTRTQPHEGRGWFIYEETTVMRNGKVLYVHTDPEFHKDDDYKWIAH
jgi:hypothetical protein